MTDPQQSVTEKLFGRTGGAYLPPAKMRQLQAQITDKSSEDYQRMTWEALKKSINGLINKINVSNIKNIVPELFSENLIRGRGLLCKSIMKAQSVSLPFTPVYASMIAVVNTKFPVIGELLIMRLLSQFRKAYKRSDKQVCLASSKFLAHLVNQRVASEIIALQLLMLLLEKPTNDSVEVAVGFMREVGMFLLEEAPKASIAVFERFRAILHEGSIDKRTQYMVEVLFQIRKEKFKDHPTVPEDLDIIEEEDQITHRIGLTDELDTQDLLNVFRKDPDFLDHEREYMQMKKEILGEESDEEEGDEEDDEEEEIEEQRQQQIQDETNTNIVNLRRAIYLTIMSSLNFEECAHKLMKLDIPKGHEVELCNMIVECCSQEKTFVTFYGLLGERFCRISAIWAQSFAQAFEETYKTIHRYETNRLRNIAKYFAHLLATDALTWEVFALIHLTEEDTTSSSRIFCKIMFTELVESMGLKKLKQRLDDTSMVVSVETEAGVVSRGVFEGIFPKDNPRNTRFAINYFTSIGLGALTEDMREWLKNAPKVVESSDSDDDPSDEDSSDDSSDEEGPVHNQPRRDSPSPVRNQPRRDSPSPVRNQPRRDSPSPERRRRRDSSSPERQTRRDSPPQRRVSRDSPSPVRQPQRRDSPSLVKRDFRSPVRGQRRDSTSPARRQRSPEDRRQRRESRSPVRRSPSPAEREPAARGRSPNEKQPAERKRYSPSPERSAFYSRYRNRSRSPEREHKRRRS